MKKLRKLKTLTAAGMLMIAMLTGLPGISFSQTTASSETPLKYQKEKSGINKDIANIKADREKIQAAREKCRTSTDNSEAQAMADKELLKAKADLKKDKAYLKADKRDLILNHELAIKAQKETIERDESNLSAMKKKLDKDLSNGDEAASQKTALAVAQSQKELDNDIAMLKRQRIEKNNDIVAINKDIEKVNGQFDAFLYVENALANTENQMQK